ncbi:MAG: hypothetical protein E3J29_01920 [Dehalococcoidia bacterium]|nr:MAG: hypothetical protein E3J29_01920 [Dehalococcoidia bacterium]
MAQGRTEAERGFNRDEATNVIQKVSGNLGSALEQLGEGNVEGAERLVGKIDQLVAPYGKVFLETVKDDATARAYNSASQFFRSELKKGLPLKAQHELEDFALQQTSWGPVFKKRDELMRPGIEVEIERMRESRETKEERAARLAKTKPPVKPGGGGGGPAKDEREQLADETTPIATIREIRARQKAAGG